MCVEKCKYLDTSMPICKVPKELRNCNTSVCCFYCPTADYCIHTCEVKNFNLKSNAEQIIRNLKVIEIELFQISIEPLILLLEQLKENEYYGSFSFLIKDT